MSYEHAKNPSTARVLPGTIAQYKLTDRERLGDYEAVVGTNGFGDYRVTNLTQGNPFRRLGYHPLTAHMSGLGEPPADDCPVGAARDPIFNLCLPTGGANNPNCPPGLVFDTNKQICVWPQDLTPPAPKQPPPPPPPPPTPAPPPVTPKVTPFPVSVPQCQPPYVFGSSGCVLPAQPAQASVITAGFIVVGALAIVGIGFAMMHSK